MHAGAVLGALAPWATGALLPNFAAGFGADRISRSYDDATLARLASLAQRFDPENILRAGQVPVRSART